ncbi:phage neck terminator protein [Serratia oryzae]|uniref:Phage neck terminator protein gp12-like domain-containing protein n=1 Tax=Serratia oryzae TaxID=2034155 RepID=A0A1S8CJN8_9GAMM|nr:hypothetical protein [Serratia oryzae]OMQ22271.1 hypothetical protein BMI79_12205 [Serratia oryzae]
MNNNSDSNSLSHLENGNLNNAEVTYLRPISSSQQDDIELERILSRWVRGVSGLPPKYVLLEWTAEQPHQPLASEDWCSLGILKFQANDNPAFTHQTDDSVQLWRNELIEIVVSFYGPHGQLLATQFRDGVAIAQNREALNQAGLAFSASGAIVSAHELKNNQWVRRYDQRLTLQRKVVREYAIHSILEAPTHFFGE